MSKRIKSVPPQKYLAPAKRYFSRLNYLGLVFGLLFYSFSVLPSLLPRPWVYQGIIGGVSTAAGYGFGVLISVVVRWLFQKEFSNQVKNSARKVLLFLGPVLAIGMTILCHKWQVEVHKLVGMAPPNGSYVIRILLLTALIFMVIVGLARLIRRLGRILINLLDKLFPRRFSVFAGSLLTTWFILSVILGTFANFFVSTSNNIYSAKNQRTPPGATMPTSTLRSGGPDSLISWKTLGYQGRGFVGRGPTVQQLSKFSGQPAVQPIRVYVGLDSAKTVTTRADLAVKELKRTGAFNRKVLVLATATGTGWLEPHSVDALEYMYNGDSAIVSQQYSYLPSWISFLVDKQKAQETGSALYDAVYGEWVRLPTDQRPKLIAYGLSLGSFGAQSAYSGINDLRHSVDGALFVGTPNDTALWRKVTDNRDKESREILPIYQSGKAVRFASTNAEIVTNQAGWQQPRVLYLQHASDPVVWFNFNLLFHKPDWLNEPRGRDVSHATRWYPVVTFLQVGVDQFFGTTVPNGHGHNYPDIMVQAWDAVAHPPGWTGQQTASLQTIINSYDNE